MRYFLLLPLFALLTFSAQAQFLELGMESTTGVASTRFKSNLSDIVGFSEIEISDALLDSALVTFGLSAPNWLKALFPGIRIEVDQEIERKLSRNVNMLRFYARVKWVGMSVAVSDPRLTEPRESNKLKNQIKSARLAVSGDAEALATHLAAMELADLQKPKPFFDKRYDAEVYVHFKKVFLGDDPLLEWGGREKKNKLDAELTGGIRFSADPSPIVDLGNVLFISEKIDSLIEGGLLAPLENTTDEIALAIQNLLFGQFKDPRTVPSWGWFVRGELPVTFGNRFSVVAGADWSVNKHVLLKNAQSMPSFYGFVGLRWRGF